MGPGPDASREPFEILGTDWVRSLDAIVSSIATGSVRRIEVWLKGCFMQDNGMVESPEQLRHEWGNGTPACQLYKIQILTRAERCIGTLVVWQERSLGGTDHSRLRECARWIAATYEVHRRFEAVVRVTRVVADARKPEEILNELLRVSAWLLRANRGDLTWYRPPSATLTLHVGPTRITGDLPKKSVTHTVIRDRTKRLITNVHAEPNYCECHERTTSEIAIPLSDKGTKLSQDTGALGVLNDSRLKAGRLGLRLKVA